MNEIGYKRADGSKLLNGLSSALQIGKAAEHLVCCELILQGFNAFMADAGLPYDIVVDLGKGVFSRVQVKTTSKIFQPTYKNQSAVYRFAIRKGRVIQRQMKLDNCDFLAFVALDLKITAFVHISEMNRPDGFCKQCIEFKTRSREYIKKGITGFDPAKYGKYIEDYTIFDPFYLDIL